MATPPTPCARTTRRFTVFAALVVAAGVASGCTPERGEDEADTTAPSTLAVPEVTEPPERRTPFCQIMLDLDETLPADQTIDVTDQVLSAYREALPVAPPEISAELEAVIIGLETGTDPTLAPEPVDVGSESPVDTTSGQPTAEEAFPEEGYLPDDNPSVRLKEFVDFTCRDNVNNPGPPPTQPNATPVPSTDGG